MQLNPHFLFNTLNTVLALIHENPKAADRMLVRLSQLLRRTLEQGQTHEVPLRKEMEFLKLYLEIEQMRFEDRLTISYDIDPKAEDLLVPQLILQPLLENALRHGILPREEPGRIELSARVLNSTLELKVRDNGNGLSLPPGSPLREGVGLANVRSRLAHLYGSDQQLTLRNGPEGGVEAIITMPTRKEPPQPALLPVRNGGDIFPAPVPAAAALKH
jgi:LytS/YehU family sensor histidine kinase